MEEVKVQNHISKYQLTVRFLQREKQNILFSVFKIKASTLIY